MYKSTRQKIEEIRAIVNRYYEPGRQDRCKLWVWRTYVYPRYKISSRTFFRYLGRDDEELNNDGNDGQLCLF